jgi:serine/threonine protein kinase
MWRINVKPDELEAMKCVRNEHLVSLMDVIDEPTTDITYLVMEFCDTDLDRYLRFDAQNERLQTPEMMFVFLRNLIPEPFLKILTFVFRTVVESIARGYYALYQKHIVHRDIKPQNVLLVLGAVENGGRKTIKSAKITDFGVSRVLADETIGLCNVAGTLVRDY